MPAKRAVALRGAEADSIARRKSSVRRPLVFFTRAARRFIALLVLATTLSGTLCVYAQSSASLGKPGEPARIRVAIAPSFAGAWTGIVALDKEFWKKHLPPGSRVDIEFALRDPVVAAALRDGRVHIGYLGDLPAVALTAFSREPVCPSITVESIPMAMLACPSSYFFDHHDIHYDLSLREG